MHTQLAQLDSWNSTIPNILELPPNTHTCKYTTHVHIPTCTHTISGSFSIFLGCRLLGPLHLKTDKHK